MATADAGNAAATRLISGPALEDVATHGNVRGISLLGKVQYNHMSRQLKRKEFKQILALPGIKLIPLQFTFTQYLRPMDLFVLDPGNIEKPQPIQLADIYQCQSGLYAREAFTDFHTAKRFEPDVAVITLRVGHL